MNDRGGRRISDKVACPACGSLQSSVLPGHQSLEQQQSGGYWRRRQCGSCAREFATREDVVIADQSREENRRNRNI